MNDLVRALKLLTEVVEANGGKVPEQLIVRKKQRSSKAVGTEEDRMAKSIVQNHFYGKNKR